MKKLLVILTFFFTTNVFSQSSEDCLTNLSIFAEYYKVKNYDSAYEPWMQVRKECPKMNVAIYTYGKRMLESFIKQSKSKGNDGELDVKNTKMIYYNCMMNGWLIFHLIKEEKL